MEFKASCAAMAGVAHQQTGIPCQDSVSVLRENGIICAALADGAGSRASSHVGAHYVTQQVCRLLCSRFSGLYAAPDSAAPEILTHCLDGLRTLPHPLYDLASTLLFFAADEQGRFLSGHLGDGMQILVTQDSAFAFSMPENGDSPGETWFVTSPDASEHFRICGGCLPPHGEQLLMSDGMAASLFQYDTREPAKACLTMARWLREEEEDIISEALAENMRMLFTRKSMDDLGLIILSW